MHEQSPLLTTTPRERVGSKYCKRLRDKGMLPIVLYGHGETPQALAINAKEAVTHFESGEKVFELDLAGKRQTALLRDLQFDYLGTNIVHADFSRVDLNERIHSRVHILLRGTAVGLKSAGNILMHPVSEIDIECAVRDLPEHIEVDITNLELGHAIHASDVKLPVESMKLLSDPRSIVAQIVAVQEVVTAEATDAAATAQPEVITEKKKEEEGSAKPDAKKKD